jgi:acetolactate synthase I/II/III large subunit
MFPFPARIRFVVSMRLSDYVVSFFEKLGVTHIFLISGGGNMFLVDAVGRNKNIKYVCNHHEQACAMAAEGFARLKNDMGVVFVTTGPAGTNAITGVAGAWLDSIPMVVVSGQVKRENLRGPGMRQLGDQELNIIDLVRPITKYAAMVEDKGDIRYYLEKAVHLAKSGRPGPVWLDIPLDVQSADIDPHSLKSFSIPEQKIPSELDAQVKETVRLLAQSKRPILVAGNGIRLAGGEGVFLRLLDKLKIPVVTAINGSDLVNEDYLYYAGRFGIMGQRGANFAIQNSDLMVGIGARFMLRQIGYNYQLFAREAKKIIVDVDETEVKKKTIKADLPVVCDAKLFMEKLLNALEGADSLRPGSKIWNERCIAWRKSYPVVLPDYAKQKKFVNSYYFAEVLAEKLMAEDHIITSNGTAYVGTLQCIKLKKGQRFITNSGLASMGYGLPAAIGACFANGGKRIICLEGDGSLQMNIQELQTLVHHNLPVKMFVFNNNGYLSIKITQNNYFQGFYVASGPESGVSCPDLSKIANAYGIPFVRMTKHTGLAEKIAEMLAYSGPAIGEIMMDPNQPLVPKLSSAKLPDGTIVSKPLEDMTPLLPRDEFRKNMIVKTVNE